MKRGIGSAAAAALLALTLAAPAEAQRRTADRDREVAERVGGRKAEDGRVAERNGGIYRDGRSRDDDRDRRGRDRGDLRQDRGDGPAFCRSGSGHPVFGWDWCRDRGWDRSGRNAVRWEQRGWDDIVFRPDERSRLDRRGLEAVLGDVVFGRLDTRRRYMGASGDYAGHWVRSGAGRELWVTVGGVPLARLLDSNGDRRVDRVYTAER